MLNERRANLTFEDYSLFNYLNGKAETLHPTPPLHAYKISNE